MEIRKIGKAGVATKYAVRHNGQRYTCYIYKGNGNQNFVVSGNGDERSMEITDTDLGGKIMLECQKEE